jgi:carbon monoxide dehydrogenase subunit G
MRKTLTIILAVVAVLLIAILCFAATKPDSFRVERSVSIKAPPEKIVALIDDFHKWGSWSPWEKLDPAMQRTFSGAPSGTGAAYAWTGNSKVGAGHMEILDASPSKVTIKLDFLKPFEGHNTAEFTLQPNGDSTRVTWAMYGPSPYMSKVMGTIFNMDNMIGKDFTTGLANMKRVAEQ